MKEVTAAAAGMFDAIRGLNNTARDKIIRVWLLACSNEDAAAWRRLVEAEKKRKQRVTVPIESKQPSGQTPASTEEPSGTNSRTAKLSQGDIAPSPQVSPLHPPSSPTPAPPHTHTREAKPATPKPEDVELPTVLAERARFPTVWLTFIDMRRLIKHPLTHHAAELALGRLTERPDDAIQLLELAIERQWQGLRWGLLDKEREENKPGHFTVQPTKHFNGNGHSTADQSDLPPRFRTSSR